MKYVVLKELMPHIPRVSVISHFKLFGLQYISSSDKKRSHFPDSSILHVVVRLLNFYEYLGSFPLFFSGPVAFLPFSGVQSASFFPETAAQC